MAEIAVTRLTVVTWNCGGGRRNHDHPVDPAHFGRHAARAFREFKLAPDLVLVQEAVRLWRDRRRPPIDGLAEAGRALGLAPYFIPLLDSDVHAHPNKWLNPAYSGFCRVQQGLGLLTRFELEPIPWPLASSATTPPRGTRYPWPPHPWPLAIQISEPTLYDTGTRDTEPRALAVARVRLPAGSALHVLLSQLATFSSERDRRTGRRRPSAEAIRVRRRQVGWIVRLARRLPPDAPLLLGGDLNAAPDSDEVRRLDRFFSVRRPRVRWHPASNGVPRGHRAFTHRVHRVIFDYVAARSSATASLRIETPHVLASALLERLSDHFPLAADVEVVDASP